MSSDDREAWQRLGELLKARRAELDPRYVNKRAFCADRGVNYRVVSDIESARRTNFTPEMLRALEVAYRLAPGAIIEAVEHGPAASLRVETVVADIPTAEGLLLVPVPSNMTAEERERVQQWAAQMAEDLVRMRQNGNPPRSSDDGDNL